MVSGLFSAAFIASVVPHICLAGDIFPSIVLGISAFGWLLLFSEGIKTGKGLTFLLSFVFLAFALNSNLEGFLLLPAGLCIYVYMRGRMNPLLLMLGLYIVLLSYYFYIDSEFSSGFPVLRTFPHLLSQFVNGKTGGSLSSGAAKSFLTNYFRMLGIFPGISMLLSLLSGLYIMAKRDGGKTRSTAAMQICPWAMLQLWGIAGLFFSNEYSRYYIVYIVGACGTISWFINNLLKSKVKNIAFIISIALLVFMVKQPYQEKLSNPDSRYTTLLLNESMKDIFSDKSLNAHDFYTNFHTIIEDNLRPGLIQLNPIATYLLIDTAPSDENTLKTNILFFLKDSYKSPLDKVLQKQFPEIKRGKTYVYYKSDVESGTWHYCPGNLKAVPVEERLKDKTCKAFNRAFRAAFENPSYKLFPEIEKDISDREPPHWRPGKKQSIYVHLGKSKNVDRRLLMVQTVGCINETIIFGNKKYRAMGHDIAKMSYDNIGYTCTTWFVIPGGDGWAGFEWKYDTSVIDKRNPELFVDVIDIKLKNGLIIPHI